MMQKTNTGAAIKNYNHQKQQKMKTRIKIAVLMLSTIGAVTGVLATAKKIADPPTKFPVVDQYSKAIQADVRELDSASNFTQSRNLYVALDDKLKRFRIEDVIDNNAADTCLKEIDTSYGEQLKTYCYYILNNCIWTGSQLATIIGYADTLSADKLSDGEQAISDELAAYFDNLHNVQDNYKAALRASRNTAYVSISDAQSKIAKAREYQNMQYLKNNFSLVTALDAVPRKIAASHYYHVNAIVSKLARYKSLSYNDYKDAEQKATKAINEYRYTYIYEGKEKSIKPIIDRKDKLCKAADAYYNKRQHGRKSNYQAEELEGVFDSHELEYEFVE